MALSDPPPPPPLEGLIEGSKWVADIFTLVCYGVFSILIGLDARRAYSKRAIWVPGKTFALTGVTVQIITWWTIGTTNFAGYDTVSLIFLQQLLVSGRVGVCVFLGYLLPQMAAPSVRIFVALAITLCAQVVSELLFLFKKQSDFEKEIEMDSIVLPTDWSKNWSKLVDFVLPICVIVLGLILGCTTSASKTINDLLKQRISAISPITEEDEFQLTHESTKSISWNEFEDEVVRSWFVARVCRVDYVISRSAFSSAVGIVVTISVMICYLSNTLYNTYFRHTYDPFQIYFYSTFSLLFSFIIIGWVVICWRWLAGPLYFGQQRRSWRRSLSVEDFWTSNIVELIHVCDLKRDRQQFDQRSNPEMSLFSKLKSFPIRIFTKIRLYKLLYLVLMIQLTVIFFSKLCGLLSEVIVGKVLHWCHKHTTKGESTNAPEKYEEILECLCMPGEDPSALWEANRMSYDNVKLLMKKSCEKGISSREINSLFCQYALQWAADGKQLLNMLQKMAISSISKRFSSVEKPCVKMTVVSLIKIFIRLPEAKSDRLTKLLKACSEVWDLLTFVDECDIDLQVDAIVLLDDLNRDKDQVHMAADSEFYKLQMSYDRRHFGCEGALRCLENLLEESEELLKKEKLQDNCKEEVIADMNDSKDWMKIAPSYSLYKLCKLMLNENIEDFVEWTEISLRNVIAFSMSRLPDVLVKQCWKWAKDFEEDKLWGAIHLAGKCKGMMEAWGLEPQSTFSTTKQQRIQVVPSS